MNKEQIVNRMLAGMSCDVHDAGPSGAVYVCDRRDKHSKSAFKVVRKESKRQGYDAKIFRNRHFWRLIVSGGPDVTELVERTRRRLAQ